MKSEDVFGLAVLFIVATIGFLAGAYSGYFDGQKSGYTQALQDMKHGNPPAYVLVEHPDGTTQWESNKENGK